MDFEAFIRKYHIELSGDQLEAVKAVDGPVLLLAAPGSGKTTVLTARLGYMIFCRGIAPEKILTLTYTVAAAKDMQRRFASIFGEETAARLEFRTINGICASIISYYGNVTGRKPFELVTSEKDILALLSELYRNVTGEFASESELKDLSTAVTYIKNMMSDADEIKKLDKKSGSGGHIADVYRAYTETMRDRGLMDYDDQLVYTRTMLQKIPDLLKYYRTRFRYILVDEAQDTSRIQHEIIEMLADKDGSDNLFMVGDEDQSIYGFRAAYPEALLTFEKRHKGARVLLMEKNYRSGVDIVKAADRFIQKNTERHPKRIIAARKDEGSVNVIRLSSREQQHEYLKEIALNCTGETAVLYRENESVIPLIDLLERDGIPYRMRNADPAFFTNRLVLDVIDILRFVLDPSDEELFRKIYYKLGTYVRKTDLDRISEAVRRSHQPVLLAAASLHGIHPKTAETLRNLNFKIGRAEKERPEQVIDHITDDWGYGKYLENRGIDDGRIFTLKLIARREKHIAGFLERLSSLERIMREQEPVTGSRIILSTIHGSKGLEYDTVYLLDTADGIFPSSVPADVKRAGKEALTEYEEERRIFYVGMTRARHELNLFSFGTRSVFIRDALGYQETPVPERPDRGVNTSGHVHSRAPVPDRSEVSEEEYRKVLDKLAPGRKVKHRKLGEGTIEEVDREKGTFSVSFPGKTIKLDVRTCIARGLIR